MLQATLPEEIHLSMPPGMPCDEDVSAADDAAPACATQGELPNLCSGATRSHSHRSHRRSYGGGFNNSSGIKGSGSEMGCRAAAAATAAAAAEAAGLSGAQQQQQQSSSGGCAVAGGGGGGGLGGSHISGRQGEDGRARGQHSGLAASGLGPSLGSSPGTSPGPHKFGGSAGGPSPLKPRTRVVKGEGRWEQRWNSTGLCFVGHAHQDLRCAHVQFSGGVYEHPDFSGGMFAHPYFWPHSHASRRSSIAPPQNVWWRTSFTGHACVSQTRITACMHGAHPFESFKPCTNTSEPLGRYFCVAAKESATRAHARKHAPALGCVCNCRAPRAA
eukprot:1158975-Pelagomonas_calceolata.AAC.9